jgi:hypothetical protein
MSATFAQTTPDGVFEIATSDTSGTAEGERRRDAALTLLESQRAVLIRRARRAFLLRLLAVGSATADDVRAAVELPSGIDPNLFGCVPSLFARLGIVAFAGFDTSRRPARHAGLNRVWELIDPPAALRWLADHPDLPDPDQAGAQMTLWPETTQPRP